MANDAATSEAMTDFFEGMVTPVGFSWPGPLEANPGARDIGHAGEGCARDESGRAAISGRTPTDGDDGDDARAVPRARTA